MRIKLIISCTCCYILFDNLKFEIIVQIEMLVFLSLTLKLRLSAKMASHVISIGIWNKLVIIWTEYTTLREVFDPFLSPDILG